MTLAASAVSTVGMTSRRIHLPPFRRACMPCRKPCRRAGRCRWSWSARRCDMVSRSRTACASPGATISAVMGRTPWCRCCGFTAPVWPLTTIVVDAVFDIRSAIGPADRALIVGVVVGEEQRSVCLAIEISARPIRMRGGSDAHRRLAVDRLRPRPLVFLHHDQWLRNQSVGSTWTSRRCRAPIVHLI